MKPEYGAPASRIRFFYEIKTGFGVFRSKRSVLSGAWPDRTAKEPFPLRPASDPFPSGKKEKRLFNAGNPGAREAAGRERSNPFAPERIPGKTGSGMSSAPPGCACAGGPGGPLPETYRAASIQQVLDRFPRLVLSDPRFGGKGDDHVLRVRLQLFPDDLDVLGMFSFGNFIRLRGDDDDGDAAMF